LNSEEREVRCDREASEEGNRAAERMYKDANHEERMYRCRGDFFDERLQTCIVCFVCYLGVSKLGYFASQS
jgi:hypothetical protein